MLDLMHASQPLYHWTVSFSLLLEFLMWVLGIVLHSSCLHTQQELYPPPYPWYLGIVCVLFRNKWPSKSHFFFFNERLHLETVLLIFQCYAKSLSLELSMSANVHALAILFLPLPYEVGIFLIIIWWRNWGSVRVNRSQSDKNQS